MFKISIRELLAFVVVVVSASDAFAIGRRGGMGGMVCNVLTLQQAAPAPAQATAANLAQVASKAILNPLSVSAGASVLDLAPMTRVDMRALQALNAKPGAGVPSAANVAAN